MRARLVRFSGPGQEEKNAACPGSAPRLSEMGLKAKVVDADLGSPNPGKSYYY